MFKNPLKQKQKELEKQLSKLETDIKTKSENLSKINLNIQEANKNLAIVSSKLTKVQQELNMSEGFIEMQENGIEYTPLDKCLDSISLQKEMIQKQVAIMFKNKDIITYSRNYYVDNSIVKGRQLQTAYGEGLLMSFNTYFEKKKKAISSNNYAKSYDLVKDKFNKIIVKGTIMGIYFNEGYLESCLHLLSLELDYKIAKAEEKEKIKKERRQLKEQEQLLAEAEKERKKLETEKANLQKLFAKAITEQEQAEIKAKLAEVDKRVEEVDWRVSHYSAGWLYITTTPSMPGIMKIGCTRQLNPLNRLAQLSSASVPFPFECRGLVFSEDVFALEAKMHNRLDSERVNKDNKLKEFFFGEPEEAIKILTDEFHEEVRFIDEQWIVNGKDNDNEID